MRFLVVDTCTERGILAYGSTDEVLFVKELSFGMAQSKELLPLLMEALKPYGAIPELAAIGTGIGPGSYTGIRMGVAVAQALAYSWNVPLIGITSLEGFIPSSTSVHFASLLDARIGGLYYRRGARMQQNLHYEGLPQCCSLEDVGRSLEGISHFVSPNVKVLQARLSKYYPAQSWTWEERAPCAKRLLQTIESKYSRGEKVIPPEHLELLYLRQTEAERARESFC